MQEEEEDKLSLIRQERRPFFKLQDLSNDEADGEGATEDYYAELAELDNSEFQQRVITVGERQHSDDKTEEETSIIKSRKEQSEDRDEEEKEKNRKSDIERRQGEL